MKYELKDNLMTLFFEGELSSKNNLDVQLDIEKTLEGKSFSSLVLDFEKLNYISSAGLRVILKLKQAYKEVEVINCSLEVYDVFEMTGFTDMMSIKKALKKVDVSKAEVVGEGFFSTVYRIDKDTIIKVFNRTSDSKQIERELKLAKQAFVLGIPTAISFDIVKVGEKLGVRFEMLDCDSLKSMVQKHPEKMDHFLKKYVELLKTITTTECDDPNIPDIKKFYLEKVEVIKPYLDEDHYKKAKKIVENIKDSSTFVHGDCHFKNIMVQGEELLLIDMDTLSVGNPIFEFAQIYAPYVAFDEDDPGNIERFFGIKKSDGVALFNSLVEHYYNCKDQVVKDKIALVAYIHMVWWNRINEPSNEVRLKGCRSRLYSLLDRYDDVNIK